MSSTRAIEICIMMLILLLCVAVVFSQILQYSTAAPMWSHYESETDISLERIQILKMEENIRKIRSAFGPGIVHNYPKTAFKLFTSEWKYNNCKSEYNCGTVSQHWCNTTLQKKMYCSQDNCKCICE